MAIMDGIKNFFSANNPVMKGVQDSFGVNNPYESSILKDKNQKEQREMDAQSKLLQAQDIETQSKILDNKNKELDIKVKESEINRTNHQNTTDSAKIEANLLNKDKEIDTKRTEMEQIDFLEKGGQPQDSDYKGLQEGTDKFFQQRDAEPVQEPGAPVQGGVGGVQEIPEIKMDDKEPEFIYPNNAESPELQRLESPETEKADLFSAGLDAAKEEMDGLSSMAQKGYQLQQDASDELKQNLRDLNEQQMEIFNNRQTYDQVISNIPATSKAFSMMSAFFGGLAGVSNPMKAIDDIIDDEVAEQKLAFEVKLKGIGAKRSLYSDLYKVAKDDSATALAMRSTLLSDLKNKLSFMEKGASTEIEKNKYANAIKEVNNKIEITSTNYQDKQRLEINKNKQSEFDNYVKTETLRTGRLKAHATLQKKLKSSKIYKGYNFNFGTEADKKAFKDDEAKLGSELVRAREITGLLRGNVNAFDNDKLRSLAKTIGDMRGDSIAKRKLKEIVAAGAGVAGEYSAYEDAIRYTTSLIVESALGRRLETVGPGALNNEERQILISSYGLKVSKEADQDELLEAVHRGIVTGTLDTKNQFIQRDKQKAYYKIFGANVLMPDGSNPTSEQSLQLAEQFLTKYK